MANNTLNNWPRPDMVAVRENKALLTLYSIGGALTGIGLLTVIIAFANKDSGSSFLSSGDSDTALAWLSFGNWVVGVGILLLVLGAVAHAINWQIEVSAHRHAYFMSKLIDQEKG